jgi:hypothetical protein
MDFSCSKELQFGKSPLNTVDENKLLLPCAGGLWGRAAAGAISR